MSQHFNSITLFEQTSKMRVKNLLATKCEIVSIDEKQKLNKYTRELRDNGYQIQYMYPEFKDMGRLVPKPYTGLATFCREVRGYLGKDYYVDVDMRNCHPTIIRKVLKDNLFDTSETLDHYILNPGAFLKELGLDKYEFLKSIYKSDYVTENVLHKAIHDQIYKELVPALLKSNPMLESKYKLLRGYNREGKTFSTYIQDIECELLGHCLTYAKNNGLFIDVLMYDGFFIRLDENTTENTVEQHLDPLAKYVLSQSGFEMKFTTKPHSNKITDEILESHKKEVNKDLKTLTKDIQVTGDFIRPEILDFPFEVAAFIAPKLKTSLVFTQGKWYYFNESNKLWICGEPNFNISSCLKNFFDYTSECLSENISVSEDLDTAEKALRAYQTTYETKWMSHLVKFLQQLLCDPDFEGKLDQCAGKMPFRNGMLDIKTMTLTDLKREDFITSYNDFDWEMSDKSDLEFFDTMMRKICNNNKEHHDYYRSVLGYSLLGLASERKEIYFLIGRKGNNGKTLITESLARCIPTYVKTINNEIFDAKGEKIHKYVSDLRTARIALVEELNKDKPINISFLKQVADGKSFNTTKMYSTTQTMKINCKFHLISNTTPNFVTDGGLENRYREIQFNSVFDNKTSFDNYDQLHFVADTQLDTTLYNNRLHFLNYFLIAGSDYYRKGIPEIPLEFKEAISDTLQCNNVFSEWFDEHCKVTPSGKIANKELEMFQQQIPVKDIKEGFKKMGFKYIKDSRKKVDGKSVKGVWLGVELLSDTEEI